jgi:hypothetical protein
MHYCPDMCCVVLQFFICFHTDGVLQCTILLYNIDAIDGLCVLTGLYCSGLLPCCCFLNRISRVGYTTGPAVYDVIGCAPHCCFDLATYNAMIDSFYACSCVICMCSCIARSFIVIMHVLVKFALLPFVVYILYYIVVDF